MLPDLLARALRDARGVRLPAGCPSCVGPVNEVGRRAKPMAATLLDHLIG